MVDAVYLNNLKSSGKLSSWMDDVPNRDVIVEGEETIHAPPPLYGIKFNAYCLLLHRGAHIVDSVYLQMLHRECITSLRTLDVANEDISTFIQFHAPDSVYIAITILSILEPRLVDNWYTNLRLVEDMMELYDILVTHVTSQVLRSCRTCTVVVVLLLCCCCDVVACRCFVYVDYIFYSDLCLLFVSVQAIRQRIFDDGGSGGGGGGGGGGSIHQSWCLC